MALAVAFVAPLALPAVVAVPAMAAQDPGADGGAGGTLPVASSLEGNYLAALVAGASRDATAAARYFGAALRADPRNRDLQERAFIAFLASGEMDQAFATARKIVVRDPENALARLALGVRDFREGKYAQARNQFRRSGGGGPVDVTATLLTAWAWAGSSDTRKALQTVDRLRGVNAFTLFREYHGGLIAALGGPKFQKEADQRLSATYALERTTLRVVDAYGRYLARSGDRDAAMAAYEAFLKLAPRQPIAQAALEALRKGEPLPLVVNDPRQGAAEVLYGLGAAGNQQGDELAAMIYLQLSLYLEPHNEMALVTLADIYERLRKFEDALAVYRKIPADSPMRLMADIQTGLALENLGRKEEAEQHLKQLIAARPDDVDAPAALGAIYRGRKEWLKAVEAYDAAISRIGRPEQRFWSLFFFRGMSHERARQWPKAEEDLKKALELVPDGDGRERAAVLNYLGYSWVDQNRNLKEAFDMLHKAVALRPRDGYIVDSLGWAYYRLGRYDDAVRELERAIALKPSDPTINDHLGDAYWKTGRKLEARFQWNHARDLDPEPDELPKILEKIANGLPDDGPARDAQAPQPASAEGASGARPEGAEQPPQPKPAPDDRGAAPAAPAGAATGGRPAAGDRDAAAPAPKPLPEDRPAPAAGGAASQAGSTTPGGAAGQGGDAGAGNGGATPAGGAAPAPGPDARPQGAQGDR